MTHGFCWGRVWNRLRVPPALSGIFWVLLAAGAAVFGAPTDVATYHNDIARTGQNTAETVLTTANVNAKQFGKLFSITLDSIVDAQPLYLSAVPIPKKGTHNVLYAVTENDSIYALDADTGAQLWKASAVGSGETPADTVESCLQIIPTIGITATPVIDRSSGLHGTIYVVAMSKNASGTYFQRLHALDLTTGAEEFGGPVTIQATYPGTGANSQNGQVVFDPEQYAERAGLLLLNHVIYTTWTSHCDRGLYTGWVIGYSESTLEQTSVLNLTPNGSDGAIWQSGAAPASDGSNIFVLDANGTFDPTLTAQGFPANADYGNAFLKLSTTNSLLAVADYFEMDNGTSESNKDLDLGSGGALVIPSQKDAAGGIHNLGVGAGKDTNIYIVNRANLGKFNSKTDKKIYQEIDGALPGGMWAMPAYYNGSLYFGPVGNPLMQFEFTDAKLGIAPASESPTAFEYPGTTPSVSANGKTNGIVWAVEHVASSVLHAYDASNLKNELYNSGTNHTRDRFGKASHFGTLTIVHGKVYVGTVTGVAVFGLLPE